MPVPKKNGVGAWDGCSVISVVLRPMAKVLQTPVGLILGSVILQAPIGNKPCF